MSKPRFIVEQDILTGQSGKQEKVEIPEGVRVISEGVFREHTELKEVILPEGLEEICEKAFAYTGIEKVTLPDSLKMLGEEAFVFTKKVKDNWGTKNQYTTIKLSKKHQYFYTDGKCVFRYLEDGSDELVVCYKNGILSYEVPQGVSRIKAMAFRYCDRMWSIMLPEGLVTIENNAFAETKIGTLTLPDSVCEIGNNYTRTYEAGKYGRRDRVRIQVSDKNPSFFIRDGYVFRILWRK